MEGTANTKGVGKCLKCSLKSREASVSAVGGEWKTLSKMQSDREPGAWGRAL